MFRRQATILGLVIVEINGTPTDGLLIGDLAQAFRLSRVTLLVDRGGERQLVTMSLDDAP